MDILWLLFLLGLALLPPIGEIHKQLILLAIGVLQLFEGRLVNQVPRGRYYAVLLKILLAMLLISHTGEISINSSYYPIFYVPVITAAVYFGAWGTILWTMFASAAYCSYLYPAWRCRNMNLPPDADHGVDAAHSFLFPGGDGGQSVRDGE